jgi:GTP cyclohydrolase I
MINDRPVILDIDSAALDNEPRANLTAADSDRFAEQGIDLAAAEEGVRMLLKALNLPLHEPHLVSTPQRVAEALGQFVSPPRFNPTSFPNEEGYDELVLVKDIKFNSLCSHHLLPFSGTAHLGYIPDKRIIGLSKLARAVNYFSRRPQVQERLTMQVADWIDKTLQPKGVGVVLRAEHACMSLRGVRAVGSLTVTSCLRGQVREDVRTRNEFMTLAHGPA